MVYELTFFIWLIGQGVTGNFEITTTSFYETQKDCRVAKASIEALSERLEPFTYIKIQKGCIETKKP